MLIACIECGQNISDQATTCPHCGLGSSTAKAGSNTQKKVATPLFLILAVVGLVVCVMTPRILLTIPVLATLTLAITSFFRRERWRLASVLVFGLTATILFLGTGDLGSPSRNSSTSSLEAAEIADFNWRSDPRFGNKGTIKWSVMVRNKSVKNIKNAKVQFTSFDVDGKMVSTTFSYVRAIPSGESRANESFADLYGTEKTANVKITEVYFADE